MTYIIIEIKLVMRRWYIAYIYRKILYIFFLKSFEDLFIHNIFN